MSSAGCDLPAKTICTGRPAALRMRARRSPSLNTSSGREADRQRVGLEQRARGDDARDADVLLGPALPRALAHEREQMAPERLPDGPQLRVRNREDAFPQRRIVVALEPVGAEVLREELGELAGNPRRRVDAVGNRRHRPLVFGQVGPHRFEHRARHSAVKPADRVRHAGRADGERRHVELRSAAVVVRAEREEPIA
ncbi:MAG: hypothetical protein DMG00_11315, partial [Acidobacteria bacterium]